MTLLCRDFAVYHLHLGSAYWYGKVDHIISPGQKCLHFAVLFFELSDLAMQQASHLSNSNIRSLWYWKSTVTDRWHEPTILSCMGGRGGGEDEGQRIDYEVAMQRIEIQFRFQLNLISGSDNVLFTGYPGNFDRCIRYCYHNTHSDSSQILISPLISWFILMASRPAWSSYHRWFIVGALQVKR